jgi:hypothetical protein
MDRRNHPVLFFLRGNRCRSGRMKQGRGIFFFFFWSGTLSSWIDFLGGICRLGNASVLIDGGDRLGALLTDLLVLFHPFWLRHGDAIGRQSFFVMSVLLGMTTRRLVDDDDA